MNDRPAYTIEYYASPKPPRIDLFGGRRHLDVVGVGEVSYRATKLGIRMKRLALHQTPPPGQAYELVTSKLAIRAGEASSALPTLPNAASERVKSHLAQERLVTTNSCHYARTACLSWRTYGRPEPT